MGSSYKYEIVSLFTFPYKTLNSYNKSELTKMCMYHQIKPTNTRKDMIQSLEFKENTPRTCIKVNNKSYYLNTYRSSTFEKTYEDIYRIVYRWNKYTIRYDKKSGMLDTNTGNILLGPRNVSNIKRWIHVIHYYETYHIYTYLLLMLDNNFLINDVVKNIINITILYSKLQPIIYKLY